MATPDYFNCILNIGMERPNGDDIYPTEVYRLLYSQGITFDLAQFHSSDTEDTMVVRGTTLSNRAIYEVARLLEQDCIAVWYPDSKEGHLIGPRAAEWGAFDPSRFLTLGGTPLSETLQGEEMTHVPHGTYAGQKFSNPQPLPLDANSANFDEYGDCVKLASIGIFPTDAQWFIEKRRAEAAEERKIAEAYIMLGLNRRREYQNIARDVAETVPLGGVWVYSSGHYTRRRSQLDDVVVAHANRYR